MNSYRVNIATYRLFDRIKHRYNPFVLPARLSIEECWSEKFDIFYEKELFIHAGLKSLCGYYLSPKTSTTEVVKFIQNQLNPVSLISQSFTPSFRRTGVFSIQHSRAEIGLFSEYFRRLAQHRTADPIHGVSYITQQEKRFEGIEYQDTFGDGGFYASLYDRDAVVLNLLTGNFVSTYLHFLEEKYKVPYKKKNSIFKGVIYTGCNVQDIAQKNHADVFPVRFNRKKIYNLLLNKGAIVEKTVQGKVVASMIRIKLIDEIIGNMLIKDPYFLVSF
jgi:aminoglycoside N3'-acetyltransferase